MVLLHIHTHTHTHTHTFFKLHLSRANAGKQGKLSSRELPNLGSEVTQGECGIIMTAFLLSLPSLLVFVLMEHCPRDLGIE